MKCVFKKHHEEQYPKQRVVCLCRAVGSTETRSILQKCMQRNFTCLKRNHLTWRNRYPVEKDSSYNTDERTFSVGMVQRPERSVNLDMNLTLIIYRLGIDIELNFCNWRVNKRLLKKRQMEINEVQITH